ncbi:MAG: response regulator [Candidatus Omnitrophica bacterium]|nr:response regulator [Candidatus Omnitrophota bacterium]MCM8790377.1 response regulator [Candidatus Omnitrophota bacterium]
MIAGDKEAYKMLVVDDESDICDFVKNFFQERGYKVLTALTGEEAIDLVKRERPHLILLDIKLRGMDGIAALKHIKEVNRGQKVIMVTALDDQDKMDEAVRLGACDYITKPLMLDHLECTVERNMRAHL